MADVREMEWEAEIDAEIEAQIDALLEADSATGPGQWTGNIHGGSGSDADRRYQQQVTGRRTDHDYHVQRGKVGADFDGYKHGALLDAKNLMPRGGVVRMWKWMNQVAGRPAPSKLMHWANSQLSEARRQLQVAGKTPIQWHVASRDGARVVRQLLRTNGLLRSGGKPGISLVVTPPRRPRTRR